MNKLSWVFKKQLISKTTCESVNLKQSELQYGNEPYLHEIPKLHRVPQVKNYPVHRAELKSCCWTQVRCFWEQCQALAKKKRKPWEDATTKASEPQKESCMARVRDRSASVDHREKKQQSCHSAISSAAKSTWTCKRREVQHSWTPIQGWKSLVSTLHEEECTVTSTENNLGTTSSSRLWGEDCQISSLYHWSP